MFSLDVQAIAVSTLNDNKIETGYIGEIGAVPSKQRTRILNRHRRNPQVMNSVAAWAARMIEFGRDGAEQGAGVRIDDKAGFTSQPGKG